MTLTFTILNNETNKVCKTKNATVLVLCDQEVSFGCGYWADQKGNKFTLHCV